MIPLGEKIVGVKLKDQNGEVFNIPHSDKKILLSFHPLAWTKICAEQMKKLDKYYDDFEELNVIPVGISVDSSFSKNAWAKELGLRKLRLLADFWPHGELAVKLGIFREKDGFSERANIILDEEGKVIFTKIYPINEVPNFEEIKEFFKK